jgi:hypothetical protein
VAVEKGPTIPASSTVETAPLVLTAGKLSKSLFQSRNAYGTILDNDNDNYEMDFSGGPGPFQVRAIYQQDGLYEAEYVPFKAGDYQVNVRLLDTDISGSPYDIVVLPGEISSLNSEIVGLA